MTGVLTTLLRTNWDTSPTSRALGGKIQGALRWGLWHVYITVMPAQAPDNEKARMFKVLKEVVEDHQQGKEGSSAAPWYICAYDHFRCWLLIVTSVHLS